MTPDLHKRLEESSEKKRTYYKGQDFDTSSDSTIICPYCGYERILYVEDLEGRNEGDWDDEKFICNECGKEFYVNRTIGLHYFTYKKKC